MVSAGNYDEISNTYKFTGELESSTRKHYVGGVESLYQLNEYTYDHMGRKVDARQKTGDNSSASNPMVLLSRNIYNELGQLRSKGLHATSLSSPAFAQTITYGYDERGWLSTNSSPLFSQSLKYQEAIAGVNPQYNGNISRQEWGGGKFYNYVYDKLSRLEQGIGSEGNNEVLSYDVMGNILNLTRHSFNNQVDQLSYNYGSPLGNQLVSISDANASNVSPLFQLPGQTNYSYDANGTVEILKNGVGEFTSFRKSSKIFFREYESPEHNRISQNFFPPNRFHNFCRLSDNLEFEKKTNKRLGSDVLAQYVIE